MFRLFEAGAGGLSGLFGGGMGLMGRQRTLTLRAAGIEEVGAVPGRAGAMLPGWHAVTCSDRAAHNCGCSAWTGRLASENPSLPAQDDEGSSSCAITVLLHCRNAPVHRKMAAGGGAHDGPAGAGRRQKERAVGRASDCIALRLCSPHLTAMSAPLPGCCWALGSQPACTARRPAAAAMQTLSTTARIQSLHRRACRRAWGSAAAGSRLRRLTRAVQAPVAPASALPTPDPRP